MFCIGQHCCPNLLTDEARQVLGLAHKGQPPVGLGAPDGGKSSLGPGAAQRLPPELGQSPVMQAASLRWWVAQKPGR